MSKDQLKHIFEESACLTPRQIKGYATGKMVHEEAHAVEVHLLSCPFCREAVEGVSEQKAHGAVSVMEKLDAGFIARHFGVTTQEIITPKNTPPVLKAGAYSTAPEKEQPKTVRKIWKPMALAASLLAVVAVLWFMRDNIFPQDNDRRAQQTTVSEQPHESVIVYQPAADSNVTVMGDTVVMAEPEMAPELEPVVADAADITPKELKEAAAKKEADKKALDVKLAAAATSLATKKPKEEIKPLPTAARQSSADALPRMGNSYTPPEPSVAVAPATVADKTEEKEEAEPVKKIVEPARTGLEKADDLYNNGKYKRALKIYQDEMGNTRSNRRDAATYMAAKCHIELGEKMQARTLLNSLVGENSVKKGQAQQLLNQLGEE